MKKSKFLIITFCVILILPLLDNIFHFSPVTELFEKRLPAEAPKTPASIDEVKKYPKAFEKFFDDNYGFRKTLIFLHSKILDNIFNQSPSASAVIGKGDWLFFDNQKSLLDAQGLAQIDSKKIALLAKSLIQNYQTAKENNIDYVLVIAADKSSIYGEYLPDSIVTAKKNHRIDKLLTVLRKENPDFPVIDLRVILLAAKKKEIIYQKTDTHWNRRGAHYGYVEIMNQLRKKNPVLKINERKDFIEVQDKMLRGDISDIMNSDDKNIDYDLREKFAINFYEKKLTKEEKSGFYKPIFFFNNDQTLPILFVYKDSFFENLGRFFAQNFAAVYTIHEFPCNIDFNIVKKYKADILIQEFWEGRVEEVADRCK